MMNSHQASADGGHMANLTREIQEVRWTTALANPVIQRGEVHLWRVDYASARAELPWLEATLSSQEITRAGRFRFPKDRERFIIRRGMLRVLLARYLRLTPHDIHFEYGTHGKPVLSSGCGDGTLRFNVSDSHDLVLCGITRDREIGVDVERIQIEYPIAQVAEQFFSSDESAQLQALPPEARPLLFFLAWTCKEAQAKATGRALGSGLDTLKVSV